MTKIYHINGTLLFEDENLSLKELVEKNKKNLRGADLTGANLTGADLTGADLTGADLTGADLTGADLRGADLTGADLTGANLTGADLTGADLRDVKLSTDNAWLLQAKQNILYIFSYVPAEVPALRQKIIEGKIDGTQYEGECCCLIGSLGNYKAVCVIPNYQKGLQNLGEQLFWQIKREDTPETNQFSKIALELCDEFLGKSNQ